MNVVKVISATVLGTSMMTLFSYQLSKLTGKQFREPELLSALASRLRLYKTKPRSAIDGWMLHYVAGSVFVIVYDKLWRESRRSEMFTNGGCAGVSEWLFWC
jgi:hypothetical protein